MSKEAHQSGGSVTTKTTTYESSSSYASEQDPHRYRSLIAPRTTIIQRTSYGPSYGANTQMSKQVQRSHAYNMMASAPSGAYSNITTTGVANVKTSRDKEKKDMQDLNERFASYIEKVRFLEAQNRKLADELDKLKSKWGKETTAIKAMYQAELDEARRLLDDAEKEKARLEIRSTSLEEQIEELRAQLEDLKNARAQDRDTIASQNQQLSEYEAEISVLRRRIEQLENDRERDKREITRLTEALNRARVDLDNETLAHIDAENRRQTLEEELEFLKQVHEQEMKELAALAYRDTTQENREFWKNEMGNALREIQATYDEKLDSMRGELETYYNLKIQEFRTGATRQNMETVHSKEESKRLRTTIADLRAKLADLEARNAQLEKELELMRRDFEEKEREYESENTELKNEVVKLRAEMEAILKELQDLMDTKLGLELEIAAYRKLLEGEENRVGLRQIVENMISRQNQLGKTTEESINHYINQSQKTAHITETVQSSSTQQTHSAPTAMGMHGSAASSLMAGSSSSSMMSGQSISGSGLSGGGLSGGMSGGASMSGASMSGSSSMTSGASSIIGVDSSLKVSQVVKGEMSAKTTYQRSAKGAVSIMECAADGKYIALENTSRKDEVLGGWRITRTIEGQEKADFTFPRDFAIRGNSKVKVWAKGQKQGGNANDIETNVQSFGVGANIITKLVNPAGEERATHVQKTIYTS